MATRFRLHSRFWFWALFVSLSTAGLAMAALATQLAYFPYDIAITREWQQSDPETIKPFLGWLNGLRGEDRMAIALAVVAFGVVRSRHRFVAAFMAVPLVAQTLNPLVKVIIERPRPPGRLVGVTEHAAGFGFPSGHVMNSVIFFGFLFFIAGDLIANRALRIAARGVCAIIIAFMGPARVYTGAHWPSDVVAGYVYGALVLMLVIWAYHRLRPVAGAGGIEATSS